MAAMNEMQKNYEEMMAEEKKEEEEERLKKEKEERAKSQPHIVNLNMDPMLDRKVFYSLDDENQMHVGRKTGSPKPEIILGGIGIQANHAMFEKRADGVYLVPKSEKSIANISVNGKLITGDMNGQKLLPNDRLIFGTGSFFLFKDPSNEAQAVQADTAENPITYELAEEEKTAEDDKEEMQEEEKIKNQEKEL